MNEWNGIRYYRYRDLSGSIFGRPGFWATVVMQQIASIGNNISKLALPKNPATLIYLFYAVSLEKAMNLTSILSSS